MWIFDDPYDDYTDLNQRYDSVLGNVSIQAGVGRVGSSALKVLNGSQSSIALVQKNLPFTDIYVVGASVEVWTGQGATIDVPVFSFLDGSTIQVDMRIRPDGHIVVTRNSTVLWTSDVALPFGESHYLEFKAKIHSSTGYIYVRMDGTQIIGQTGLNTQATGSAQIGALRLGHNYNPPNAGTLSYGYYLDDLILLDTTGTYNKDFIGDHHLGVIVPDGVGDSTVLSLVGAATNWQAVNEVPPSTSQYVESNNPGDYDLYTYQDIDPTAGTIAFVSVWPYANKEDGGPRSLRVEVESGATTTDNGTDLPLSTGNAYLPIVFEVDPDTTNPWDIAGVDAAQFGPKVAA